MSPRTVRVRKEEAEYAILGIIDLTRLPRMNEQKHRDAGHCGTDERLGSSI